MTEERPTCTYRVGDFDINGQKVCGKPGVNKAIWTDQTPNLGTTPTDRWRASRNEVVYCKMHWNTVEEYVRQIPNVIIFDGDPVFDPEFC